MTAATRRLSPERAEVVETQVRARAEQLRPTGEELHRRPTALGLCHACATIVYSGDSLAMAGGYLFHDPCAVGGAGRPTPAR